MISIKNLKRTRISSPVRSVSSSFTCNCCTRSSSLENPFLMASSTILSSSRDQSLRSGACVRLCSVGSADRGFSVVVVVVEAFPSLEHFFIGFGRVWVVGFGFGCFLGDPRELLSLWGLQKERREVKSSGIKDFFLLLLTCLHCSTWACPLNRLCESVLWHARWDSDGQRAPLA